MTGYISQVALLSSRGDHLRYIPKALAQHMVGEGIARANLQAKGRIRHITLVETAQACAERVGEASAPHPGGVKFWRWVRLEQSAARVVEHHPRCFWI